MSALGVPINAETSQQLYQRIRNFKKPPALPKQYSKALNDIIKSMLNIDATERPTIDDILEHKEIKSRISKLMGDEESKGISRSASRPNLRVRSININNKSKPNLKSPSNRKLPYVEKLKSILATPDVEDIYDSISSEVKRALSKLSKFDFRGKPNKDLISKPLHTFENGDKYLGQWNPDTNKQEGQGVQVRALDGRLYEGYFKDGLKHGRGRYIFADKTMYEGQWENGKKHGYGVFKWPNGGEYEGYFRNDKRNGYGIYFYPNGDEYYGEWQDDFMHGNGELRYANGITRRGTWQYDRYLGFKMIRTK